MRKDSVSHSSIISYSEIVCTRNIKKIGMMLFTCWLCSKGSMNPGPVPGVTLGFAYY